MGASRIRAMASAVVEPSREPAAAIRRTVFTSKFPQFSLHSSLPSLLRLFWTSAAKSAVVLTFAISLSPLWSFCFRAIHFVQAPYNVRDFCDRFLVDRLLLWTLQVLWSCVNRVGARSGGLDWSKMSGGTEAFVNLGRHCSEETCHQLDFLPFKCDSCRKMFCLDHRSYKAHDCPKAALKDSSVIICPVCTARVKNVFGEKPESTLKKHNDADVCSPALPSAKPKCPVKGCRELLTFSNTYHCKSCRKDTCLKHRYTSAHLCAENKSGLFLEALAKRGAADCATSASSSGSSKRNSPQKIERRLGSLSLGKAH